MCGCKKCCCAKIIGKLYYKTRTINNIGEYIINSETIKYSTDSNTYTGKSFRPMTDSNFVPKNDTTIIFDGTRTRPRGGPEDPLNGLNAQYQQRIFIKTPDGQIEASAVNDDAGTGAEVLAKTLDYPVIYATGKYIKVKKLRIIFDNLGNITGVKYSRIIELWC